MLAARGMLVAMASAVALAGDGCGGVEKPASAEVRAIAVATSGSARAVGLNQQGVSAASRVARLLHIRATVADELGDRGVRERLARLARAGASLVIANDRDYGAAASAIAAETGVPALVLGRPERLEPGRVGDVEVATQEGGYVAGYIAARASYVRSVGIVVAADNPDWYRTAGGFIAGARKFDPHVKIRYANLASSEQDPAPSQAAAKRMIVAGSQMVLGLGDGATLGVMRATLDALRGRAEPRFDAMFIDVVGDKSGAGRISITGLTAVKWNFAIAYRQAVHDIRAGTFGRRPYTLNLANGGVSVIHDGRTPEDNYRAALALGRKIQRGAIAVPVTTTDAAVQQLLEGHA